MTSDPSIHPMQRRSARPFTMSNDKRPIHPSDATPVGAVFTVTNNERSTHPSVPMGYAWPVIEKRSIVYHGRC
jgi:hypothetical protein